MDKGSNLQEISRPSFLALQIISGLESCQSEGFSQYLASVTAGANKNRGFLPKEHSGLQV